MTPKQIPKQPKSILHSKNNQPKTKLVQGLLGLPKIIDNLNPLHNQQLMNTKAHEHDHFDWTCMCKQQGNIWVGLQH